MTTIAERADLFRSLHVPGTPLALCNVWDAASAAVVQASGALAVATTSAGVAWAHGSPDGDRLDRDTALRSLREICAVTTVPVTADVESGFADDAAGVAETVRGVIDAGAVGINIEDGDRPVADLAARIDAARAAADQAGVALYINARTDVYLRGLVESERRVDEVLERSAVYLHAGANGLFVPGLVDPDEIAAVTSAVKAPVNIMVGPGAPTLGELAQLGVARASLGSAVAQAAYGLVQRAAAELLQHGTYESVADGADYGSLNGWVGRA